jgi:hypothetical protein
LQAFVASFERRPDRSAQPRQIASVGNTQRVARTRTNHRPSDAAVDRFRPFTFLVIARLRPRKSKPSSPACCVDPTRRTMRLRYTHKTTVPSTCIDGVVVEDGDQDIVLTSQPVRLKTSLHNLHRLRPARTSPRQT